MESEIAGKEAYSGTIYNVLNPVLCIKVTAAHSQICCKKKHLIIMLAIYNTYCVYVSDIVLC
jgi:hypothetical protein